MKAKMLLTLTSTENYFNNNKKMGFNFINTIINSDKDFYGMKVTVNNNKFNIEYDSEITEKRIIDIENRLNETISKVLFKEKDVKRHVKIKYQKNEENKKEKILFTFLEDTIEYNLKNEV